jgi:uncharacterized repeat protein (TIGR03806 family)
MLHLTTVASNHSGFNKDFMTRTKAFTGFAAAALAASLAFGCNSPSPGTSGQAGSGGKAGSAGQAGTSGTGGSAGGVGSAGSTGGAGVGSDAAADTSVDASGAAGQGGSPADGGGDAPLSSGPCTPFANVDQPIVKLSDTGCMDPNNPTKLASIVVPYEVNSPLWSDNANKERGFVIPKGSKIHVKDCATASAECTQGPQDTGKWVMPVGTVMVKSFSFDGKLVETRLLMHTDDATWSGYSYQWNEAQTEATVVPADDDPSLNNMRAHVMFNTGQRTVSWIFPYRFDCTGCHTKSAGGTLGPETRQMNRKLGNVATNPNQIDSWKGMGLFEGAGPPTPYQAALVLPYDGQLGTAPKGAATLEARARSYLHANCAYCHRPDGDFSNMDFRFDTTFKNMGACGVTPAKGDVGVLGALVLSPGQPMLSSMWLRMHAPYMGDRTRMPQLATYVLDDLGLGVISDWITSVKACPP